MALARKLAVILHRMLITGEAFRWRKGGRDDSVNHHEERPRFRASGRDVPAGTVAEAIPRLWLQGGPPSANAPYTPVQQGIPAEAKGHYHEASAATIR